MGMSITGKNHVAGRPSAEGNHAFHATDPRTGVRLDPAFVQATQTEVAGACHAARMAFEVERRRSGADRARLLDAIATRIEALGETLIERATAETGLPGARLQGERGRTTGQLRMFAALLRDGSWVDARIDRAQPERSPVPRPDLRRMLVGIGPVAVFGASNFPLAFSVAGGDTASALAAGCPVVCKAHPAHPGTSELVATAIAEAIAETGFHPGMFSLLHGIEPDVSLELVCHPAIQAVGFTGSLRAGRALYDAASARPQPIPVFAEMGSTNPVFVLPGALAERADTIATGLVSSVTLGSGQFCTNPGLVFGIAGTGLDRFAAAAGQAVSASPALTMLHDGIKAAYASGISRWTATTGVRTLGQGASTDPASATVAQAAMLMADARTFIGNPHLHEEIFGPVSLVVEAEDRETLLDAARRLEGNLTATVHGTPDDLARFADLVALLETRVGRLIFNGYPTGVEVCPAMTHGGPWPATTDARSTSVGTAAIFRFARPVTWQGFPEDRLPPELRDANPLGIRRLIDGVSTTDPV